MITDENCDMSAPWKQWHPVADDMDAVATSRGSLLFAAELASTDSAKSVLHHLKLLAMAYPPSALREDGLDPRQWPGLAPYSVARSLLEAAAMLHWSLAPNEDERLQHSARVELWSACAARKGGRGPAPGAAASVEAIRKIVENAGFAVNRYGRSGDLGIVVDGRVRGFAPTQVITDFMGTEGRAHYHLWSGLAHHAGWAVRPWGTLQFSYDGSGVRTSTSNFEDLHVELAADTASVILAAGRTMGRYYGRGLATFTDVCGEVERHMRALVSFIRQALGRPDSDPTDTRTSG
ncbi:hypothetical protein [Actinokineospora xionganensis]|uniref:Uncharacterized protein n=1 Tax=Actinokineospora xionganensis TaxID=2684470 RepID=A0ABR7LFF9_9PSEU|nr:hypothetical protein [Actinokineospora xionganensis]MBC6451323.1 hypothetical protein [Actinokineospora xionganensis]